MPTSAFHNRYRNGFSLVELSMVVLLVAVLAAFGIPRLLRNVEKAKAAEAFQYLAVVRAAQERYHAQQGRYTSGPDDLDVEFAPLHYFALEKTEADETSWKFVLKRVGPSAGYGEYAVVFEEDGYNKVKSTIPRELMPVDFVQPGK